MLLLFLLHCVIQMFQVGTVAHVLTCLRKYTNYIQALLPHVCLPYMKTSPFAAARTCMAVFHWACDISSNLLYSAFPHAAYFTGVILQPSAFTRIYQHALPCLPAFSLLHCARANMGGVVRPSSPHCLLAPETSFSISLLCSLTCHHSTQPT